MASYDEAMSIGAQRYADVLAVLRAEGLPAEFTQTGGMCAAIEARLEGGSTLLVTDAEDSLAWERQSHRGWGVGLYRPVEAVQFLAKRLQPCEPVVHVLNGPFFP